MAVAAATSRPDFGAGQLVLADSRLAFVVLNHVRVRALQRLFGIPREQANLLTFVLALTATGATLRTARRVSNARLPLSGTDAAIGGFAMREAAIGVAGPAASEVSPFATLISIALLGGLAIPALRRSARTLRRSARTLRAIEHRVRLLRERQYASARRTTAARFS